ncbi:MULTISPECIES: hypothetical protein [Clostridium]|uniref:hypothetical protein n=1 Tax=Clostridium TaxID=1485 RepID=UPI002583F8E3|nr:MULTISPECIES: hypothetical protein [Clostridium]MDU4849780.1 hypothetical protein [Clostridium sp.]CAI3192872.1 hypothetical protein CNEO2_130051 [Clostridium neonatale]CAI3202705.1 hypothetical protein CNEO2_260051 [Clostridium neonatale]CAI3594538.1 hypothetical protein CNEO4_210052 [Clostridium neonatale]
MNNDIYILLLYVMQTVLGVLVFTLLSNVFVLYVIVRIYRKEKKEPVVISYDKFNKGQEL